MKALACHLPAELGLPFSRLSLQDLRSQVIQRGIVARISGSTIWRWLSQDAIRPWRHRSWIYPRDPDFAEKAGRALDLYARVWQGRPLGPRDCVLCADEMTGIQLRRRIHPTEAPRPGRTMRVEHEYKRLGTLAYLAAWDVHQAALFGRIEPRCTISAFDRLVEQIISQEPYRSAERVFLVVDNGTVHHGQRSIDRLHTHWPNLILVHLPVHASWLNQIEIYFSILKRKVLTPDDFASPQAAAIRILEFQDHYQGIAKPFEWKFTRQDLAILMASLSDVQVTLRRAA
ncbi:MAG: IS630 family transposase [Anaerolineales bacterium]|nr:IS630 family transposase [Anaerolineales bacterium]